METAVEIDFILEYKCLEMFDPSMLAEDSRVMTQLHLSAAEKLFSQLSAEISEIHRPQIHFRLTNHLGIDAFVSQLEAPSQYLVAMGYGVLANLYGIFGSLLAHPEILIGIGNSRNTACKFETAPEGLLEFTYYNPAIRNHASLSRGFPLYNYPIDEDRMQYVLLLTDIAMKYIIYHEWGHILYGHLRYLNTSQGHNEITETGASLYAGQTVQVQQQETLYSKTIGGEPIRKVMEYNADYEASCMAARLPEDIKASGGTGFLNYPKAFLERYDLRDAVVFALLTLFHIFHETRLKDELVDSALYPTPYLRFTSLFAGIYGNPEYDASQIWDNYNYRGAAEFANASNILGFDLLFSNEMFNQPALNKSVNQILDQLAALNAVLKAYQLT